MKPEHLMDAIGQLPEELIAPVAEKRNRRKLPWMPLAAVAACLCLLLAAPTRLPTAEKNDAAEAPMEMAPDSVLMDSVTGNQGNAYGATQATFQATVVAVFENYLLVEPAEDSWERTSADRVEVTIPNPQDGQTFAPGDRIRVTYSGTLLESYPAQAQNVTEIERLG